jgi:hypothetical protein
MGRIIEPVTDCNPRETVPWLGGEHRLAKGRNMQTSPVISQHRRDRLASATMFVSAVPRALAWLLGALLGSLVAGFVQGWRDAA